MYGQTTTATTVWFWKQCFANIFCVTSRFFTMYIYLIVGSGLYGAVMAQQLQAAGKKVLVIDKRPHIAGNVYTENVEGIHVV